MIPGPACTQPKKPIKWAFTPETDEEIRKAYMSKIGFSRRPELAHLALKLGIPRWKIQQRARRIGAYQPRIKEPPWSEQELHLLELNAMYACETIQRRMKAAGFMRSIAAIDIKRARMAFRQQQDPTSCRAVSVCFGVDVHTIMRWIEKGWLRATKKGTKRLAVQGGDEWVIKPKDIRAFVVEHVGVIDLRKVDKFWFVAMLAGCSL